MDLCAKRDGLKRKARKRGGTTSADLQRKAGPRGFARGHAHTATALSVSRAYPFTTTSPDFRKCAFFAFLILQLTTLYSGHIASESLTLLVIRFSIISGKWKVLLSIPGFTSSVMRALMSTLPRALSTHTMSP